MSFPLYRRPGGVVFLDDDASYLEMLADVMPGQWPMRLYLDPRLFINEMQQEPPRWEADVWKHQSIIEEWRAGHGLIPGIIDYWAGGNERFGFAQVCVVDYSMPGLNGLEALGELVDWHGSRVLLTGRADEQIAVSAFNDGLIEQFIPKQAANLSGRLTDVVQRLLDAPNRRLTDIWLGTLSREQHSLIRIPSIHRDLGALAARQNWVEHVLIGEPFGVLGLDSDARVQWLQLETSDDTRELAELAQSQGVAAADVSAIRANEKLIDLELRLCLDLAGPPRMQPAFAIGQGPKLYGALFSVETPRCPAPAQGFSAFLRAIEDRRIKG